MAYKETKNTAMYAVEIKRLKEDGLRTGFRSSFFTQNTGSNEVLVSVSLIQKMYKPGCLEVKLQTTVDISYFRGKLISLYSYPINDKDQAFDLSNSTKVVSDYYIFNIKKKKEYIILTAYSPDYFLTLDTFCQAFTAKTLVEDIFTSSLINIESENFDKFRTILTSILPYQPKEISNDLSEENKKKELDKQKNERQEHINAISSELKKKLKSSVVNFLHDKKESIIPYAVQYNESFYDFMVRMCNRDGEFLYMDGDNNLCVGLKSKNVSDVDIFNFNDAEIEYVESYQKNDTSDWNYANYLGKLEFKKDDNNKSKEEKENINSSLDYILNFNNNNDVSPKQNCYVLAPEYLEDTGDDTLREAYSSIGDYTTILTGLMNAFGYLAYERNILDTAVSFSRGMADEYIHYANWIWKRNDKFKKTYPGKSLYSTNKTARNNDEYRKLYKKLDASNVGQVKIITSTNPYLNVGDIVNEKNSNGDVIGTYVIYETNKSSKQGDDNKCIEEYELLLIKKFEEKDKDGKILETEFYPLPMPEIRFKRTSAQRAIVVDNFDPSRLGRVRVKYPWQSAADNNYTPWIRISSPMASKDAGFIFTPEINDEVLIDYEDGNIERPYVCGAFYNETNKPAVAAQTQNPGLVKSITSNRGHHISFTDNGGSERFLASSFKLAKLITSYGVGEEIFNGKLLDRYLGGGFEISDYYGVYSIKGCTHNRSIDISSPYGNVSIDAFQGITINAPLGDVKIVGKNVSIEARNNLTIESGTNIKPFIKGKKADWINKTLDVANSEFLDISVYRNLLEAVLRPIGGTMLLKSNRYMRLEAGKGKTTIDKIEPSLTEKSNFKKFIIKGAFESEKDVIIHRVTERMNSFFSTYSALKARIEDLQIQLQGLSSSNPYVEIINSMIDDRGNVVASLTSQSYINLEISQKQILDNIRDTIGSIKESIPNNFENYKVENKVRTSYNNLLDALKNMVKSRNFQLSNIEDLNKRELMYYEFKAEITGEIQDKFGIQFSSTEDSGGHNFDLQYLSSQIRQQIEEDEEKLSKGMVAAKLLGWEHFKDDKVWTTKDEGAILISDTEDSFFKIRNDGTISKHFNKKTNDVIQAIHNAGE